MERFKKIHYLTDYIEQRSKEIDQWNQTKHIDKSIPVNGRRMTNIGTFRKYIEEYIRDNFILYKKIVKRKFDVEGIIIEDYVIADKNEFIEQNGAEVEQFIGETQGLPVIVNVEKFLDKYADFYMMENEIIFRVKKIQKRIISRGVDILIDTYEKIVEKPGKFNGDLTTMVRQQEPSERGVPIQVYCFATTTDWVEFEAIQSDLFDHLLAIISQFDLRIFQYRNSEDFRTKN